MKKFVPILVSCGVLLFGFQNCSQQSINKNENAASVTPSTKIEDPALSKAESVDILTQQNQTVSLDLKTGRMSEVNSGVSEVRCLPDSVRAEVLDVLNSSNLCEFQEPGPDQLCAEVYSAPYAEIHWSDKQIKVGEMFSSCHKDIDLCGNDGKLLRGILKDIVSRWSEWSCDFKVVTSN